MITAYLVAWMEGMEMKWVQTASCPGNKLTAVGPGYWVTITDRDGSDYIDACRKLKKVKDDYYSFIPEKMCNWIV